MTNIKFEPFGARVVVKVDETVVKKGDIITPDIAKKEGVTGTVVAVGRGVESLPKRDKPYSAFEKQFLADAQPAAGDRVRFLAHTGNEIEVDGQKYLVLDEHCVIGRFT